MANNDYPKAKYHSDGSTRDVFSEEEERDLGSDWSDTPSDIHRTGRDPALNPASVSNISLSAAGVEEIVRRVIREELGSRDEPRRRGRPPGGRNDGDETNG